MTNTPEPQSSHHRNESALNAQTHRRGANAIAEGDGAPTKPPVQAGKQPIGAGVTRPRFPWWIAAIFMVAAAAVVVGGLLFYRAERDRLAQEAETRLESIAELKVAQIVGWRTELLADAFVLMQRPAIESRVHDFMVTSSTDDGEYLAVQFDILKEQYSFSNILIVDTDGAVRLDLEEETTPFHREALDTLERALDEGMPLLTGIHAGIDGAPPHIGVIAPFYTTSGDSPKPIGAIVLSMDARTFLYPLLQSWPTPSDTAETLLVEISGDDVLFVNDLRFSDNAALQLRVPLTETDVPAVMAVTGTTGLVYGRDYRNVPVLAVLKPVPDSKWFMVAKVDQDEVFSGWSTQLGLIIVLMVALIVVAVAMAAMLWQRGEKERYASLLQAQRNLKRLEWMLSPRVELAPEAQGAHSSPPYGDLTTLNTARTLLDAVGAETLRSIARDYLDLLETSAAVYETNGDYALGLFASGWCQLMDSASRNLCGTEDNSVALDSGRWHCHESCWTSCSKLSIESGQPVDIECLGGIHLYAVPIFSQGKAVGSINIGYGDPPTDPARLQELADRYSVPLAQLEEQAAAYETRPPFLIELAKERLRNSATLIGALVERTQAERARQQAESLAQDLFENTDVGIILSRLDGTLVDCNQTAVSLFGFESKGEMLSVSSHSLFANTQDRTPLISLLHSQGRIIDYEIEMLHKDGTRFFASFRSMLTATAESEAALSAITDISVRKKAEEALKESEWRYRHIANNTVDVIWRMDLDTIFTYVNPAITSLTGFTPEEWERTSLAEHTTPEAFQYMGALIAHELQHMESHVGVVFESTMLRKDGSEVEVEIRGKVIADENGRPVALQGVTRDITEAKRASRALRDSEEKFRTLFEQSGEAISVVAPDGSLLEANPAWLTLFACSREELSSLNIATFYADPTKRGDFLKKIAKAGFVKDEVRQRRRDGTEFLCERNAVVQKDRDGTTIAFQTAVRDITEQRHAEHRLALHGLRTQALLDLHLLADSPARQLFDFVADASRRLTESQFAWLGLMNEGATILSVHTWTGGTECSMNTQESVLPVADGELWAECVRQAGPVIVNDYSAPHSAKKSLPDGHIPIARFMAVPVLDQSRVIAIVAVANKEQDYDEDDVYALQSLANQMWEMLRRQRADEQLRTLNAELEQRVSARTAELESSNKELESFGYSISHDLRSPLRAINGFSQVILEDYGDQFDDEGHRLFGIIRNNAQKMDVLISDLLNLARVTRTEIRFVRVDMASLTRSVIDELTGMYPESTNTIQFSVQPMPPARGDATLLRQAWRNLLENAIKFTMKSETRQVEVGGRVDGKMNVYYVKDSGAGFDTRYKEKLFHPFERLHSSEEFQGTGIGLAIVQRIVQRHGGRVWAEGTLGKGAVFHIALPTGEGER
ncbi:MAG: PAS domain S-box protein [Dehalococcoidia bacterium]|nr:PAS domain S-box protein [Dehalococcoidia bacterium]